MHFRQDVKCLLSTRYWWVAMLRAPAKKSNRHRVVEVVANNVPSLPQAGSQCFRKGRQTFGRESVSPLISSVGRN